MPGTSSKQSNVLTPYGGKTKPIHELFELTSGQIRTNCNGREMSIPPEGTMGVRQGRSDGEELPPGTEVEVRPLCDDLIFGEWMKGTVVEHMWAKSVTGNEVETYSVKTSSGIESYTPCMGELRDGRLFSPLDTYDRPLDEMRVYAFTIIHNLRGRSDVPIWTPAILLSPIDSDVFMVMPLSQKELKRNPNTISARYVLPYNEETALAIRKQDWNIEPEEWHKDFARWYVIAEILHRKPTT